MGRFDLGAVPNGPGVYVMFDTSGSAVYVGINVEQE
jgi:excinuclease UvrABC nuclease subunit